MNCLRTTLYASWNNKDHDRIILKAIQQNCVLFNKIFKIMNIKISKVNSIKTKEGNVKELSILKRWNIYCNVGLTLKLIGYQIGINWKV